MGFIDKQVTWGHALGACPLWPEQRTQFGHAAMSKLCQEETHGLGPIDIHRIQIMAAARWMKPVKLTVRLS